MQLSRNEVAIKKAQTNFKKLENGPEIIDILRKSAAAQAIQYQVSPGGTRNPILPNNKTANDILAVAEMHKLISKNYIIR